MADNSSSVDQTAGKPMAIKTVFVLRPFPGKESLSKRLRKHIKSRTRELSYGFSYTLLIVLLTIYALFGDDIKLAATEKSSDLIFDGLTILCIVVFSFDTILQCIDDKEYILSFYFFVDILSILSLTFDLSYTADILYASKGTGNPVTGSRGTTQVGAGVGRAQRIVRLVRLVRVAKVYKLWMSNGTRNGPARTTAVVGQKSVMSSFMTALHSSISPRDDGGSSEDSDSSPKVIAKTADSRVGKQLAELVTQKLCLMVLVLILVVPQLSAGNKNTTSIQISADAVTRAFAAFATTCSSSADPVVTSLQRRQYEYSFVETIYNHNWNAGSWFHSCDRPECVSTYVTRLGWVGFVPGTNALDFCASDPRVIDLAGKRSELDAIYGNPDFLKVNGLMSPVTMDTISSPWALSLCEGQTGVPDGTMSAAIDPSMTCPDSVRVTEKSFWYPWLRSPSDPQFVFVLDERANSQWTAILSICRTISVGLVVGLGLYMFSRDTAIVVVAPIERILFKMKQIRENPLAAVQLTDAKCKREIDLAAARSKWLKRPLWQRAVLRLLGMGVLSEHQYGYGGASMETEDLERTILKIGSLLVLGFGEAGAEVIANNMEENDANLNVLTPGKRVEAVFGYCRIRNFNVVTEVLQHKVMLFVNQIGEIVHGIANEFHGYPNSNLGSGFLLLWKLPPPSAGGEMSSEEKQKRQRLCDLAVISFTKIIAAVNRSPALAVYRVHPNLMTKLPGYRVCLGMAMHLGWGIEGAVGSEFKIDASYLGTDVKFVQSLENYASHVYDCPFMLSASLILNCSKHVGKICRWVDRVSIAHVAIPIDIFSLDLDPARLRPISVDSRRRIALARSGTLRDLRRRSVGGRRRQTVGTMLRTEALNKFHIKEQRTNRKETKLLNSYSIAAALDDGEIGEMRRWYNSRDGELFKQTFEAGVANFVDNEFDVATELFTTALSRAPPEAKPDGPSLALLEIVENKRQKLLALRKKAYL